MDALDLEKNAELLVRACSVKGAVDLDRGLWLYSSAALVSEQAEWDDEDASKNEDFSRTPFWILHENGLSPEPVADVAELAELLARFEFDDESLLRIPFIPSNAPVFASLLSEDLEACAAPAAPSPFRRI